MYSGAVLVHYDEGIGGYYLPETTHPKYFSFHLLFHLHYISPNNEGVKLASRVESMRLGSRIQVWSLRFRI